MTINDTPREMIDKMNEKYSEWKTTPQVEYDKDGHKIGIAKKKK